MGINRKLFQGVSNIIKFNWHFYFLAGLLIIALVTAKALFPLNIQMYHYIGVLLVAIPLSLSLFVSYYIYDFSKFYNLNWTGDLSNKKVLNIHAGFDETSELIKEKFENIDLTIGDFYDPLIHTEVSIKRARKTYPPNPKSISVKTTSLPFEDNCFDISLATMAAHEVRDKEERIIFIKELNRITKSNGEIIVTEHLRDGFNFFAYTIGFFHFYSFRSWKRTFQRAGLSIKQKIKTTPFITTFVLEKNDTSS